MRRIFLLTFLSVFVLGSFGIFCEYVDLGDDPDKIIIKSIQEIPNSELYDFEVFSPDGEFIAFTEKKTIKSIILRKEGSIYKRIDDNFITWTNNKNQIIAYEWIDVTNKQNLKIVLYNLKTEQKKYLNLYSDKTKVNSIDYNIYNSKLIFGLDNTNDLYEYDFITDKSSKIFSFDFKIDEYVATSKNSIILSKTDDKDKFRWKVTRYNRNKNVLKDIFPNLIRRFDYYNVRVNKVILSFEFKGSVYFIDPSGNILSNKIKLFPFKYPEHKNRTFSYDLSPNGKLVCVTNGFLKYEMDDGFTEADLFIFNLNGKWKRLTNTKERLEFISSWSPQGDSLIFYDNKTKKYFLAKLGKTN